VNSLKVFAGVGAIAALVFFAPLIGVVFGAFSGFIVGLFFEQTITEFMTRAGFEMAGYHVWQIGAALGFLGAFFRSPQAATAK